MTSEIGTDPPVAPAAEDAPDVVPDPAPWRGRFVLYLLGVGLLAFGLRGIATNAHGWTHPLYWAIVLVIAAVAHDLVLVPLVFAVAVPLHRVLPAGVRSYAATGLALSGVLLIVSWAGLHGYGRLPDNPSVLPLDYGHGLRTTLTVLWLVLLLVYIVRAFRTEVSRPEHRTAQPAQPARPAREEATAPRRRREPRAGSTRR